MEIIGERRRHELPGIGTEGALPGSGEHKEEQTEKA